MEITQELIAAAEQLVGLRFTAAERELMRNGLHKQLENYAQLRSVALVNDVPPALLFDPQPSPSAAPISPPPSGESSASSAAGSISLTAPADLEQLAFAPVTQLAALIRTRQVSSTALTEMYLCRLKPIRSWRPGATVGRYTVSPGARKICWQLVVFAPPGGPRRSKIK